MGIYVRQKLLASLGLDPSAPLEPSAEPASVDVEEVVSQLRRLHSDLKTFVAESISLYGIDPSLVSDMVQGDDVMENFGLPETSHELQSDDLEQIAERAFAISPRLGAIDQSSESSADSSRRTPETVNPTAPQERRPEQFNKHDLHRRDSQKTPFLPANLGPAPQAPSAHDSPLLEEDPLDKLLPKSTPRSAATDDDVDADDEPIVAAPIVREDLFDVPLSIAERKRQLAKPAADVVRAADQQWRFNSDEQSASAVTPAATPDPVPAAEAVVPAEEPQPIVSDDQTQPVNSAQAEPEVSPPIAPQNANEDENLKPNTDSGRTYPSFSGSPPPKRRQV